LARDRTAGTFLDERGEDMTPAHEWPEGYAELFAGVPDDFARPLQGEVEKRISLR